MSVFPVMPVCGHIYNPRFSATLVWSGATTLSGTLDVAQYITQPFTTLVIIQFHANPGGGETPTYPPVAKLNGVDVNLVVSTYTNAYDDGYSVSVSVIAVPYGSPAVITWTATASASAAVYAVTGFKDMFASLYDTAASVNLASNNSGCSRNTTVNITALSKVLYISLGGISTDVDLSGRLDQFDTSTGWLIGWDYDPLTPPTQTYYGGNRMTQLCAFNLDTL